MEDKLFEKFFFEPERWEKAIRKGIEKGISRAELSEMCRPEWRRNLAFQFLTGNYRTAPPHMALIPKDKPGEFRTVFVNEAKDRVILSMINDLMIEEFRQDMIHPHCVSYLPGIGTGKIVTWISGILEKAKPTKGYIGWKSDLSKYFDSVPLWAVDALFDKMPKSCVIEAARQYYHADYAFDTEGNLVQKYQSLKQGCAVASFLADALLFDMDEKLTQMAKQVGGVYYRYSDDCLYIGRNYEEAMRVMKAELARFELTLNPKKVQYIKPGEWFKFLGWNLNGDLRTLSASRVKKFQKEIYNRTMRKARNGKTATTLAMWYMYGGEHPWAGVLSVINVPEDVKAMDEFVKDCIRCTEIGRRKPKDVGGLGVDYHDDYTITRGKGQAVRTARERTPAELPGYLSLNAARNALLTNHVAYETLLRGYL